ncbi:Gluconate transport-inducing protein [Trachipleistophora hominis]|uniref:Gluconate transport-inducing protein n=1 Tax=Trachipleistophora hominis TaxID=72359 RepID=L7JUD0_TRAHO|nr:Gluconate transport-inducing protein [Trachipleistophora hominis]
MISKNINLDICLPRMSYIRGYLHTYDEAFLMVHAVRLGLIKPYRERLSLKERDDIRSGNIYIFIEDKTLMMRWTDGRTWSPSKILGSFLLYKEVPKNLTKNATMKNRRNKMERLKCTPLEKQLQQDKFLLHKKTISLSYGRETYHIIAYFQPIFDKRSILALPFFIVLDRALKSNHELLNNEYVRKLRKAKVSICKRYNLLECNKKNLTPNIDRKNLENEALKLLTNRFDINKV